MKTAKCIISFLFFSLAILPAFGSVQLTAEMEQETKDYIMQEIPCAVKSHLTVTSVELQRDRLIGEETVLVSLRGSYYYDGMHSSRLNVTVKWLNDDYFHSDLMTIQGYAPKKFCEEY